MLDFLHRNKEKNFILLSLVGKRDFFQRSDVSRSFEPDLKLYKKKEV